MNAVTYALNEVRHRIPPQILKLLFNRNRVNQVIFTGMEQDIPVSIQGELRRAVIDSWILPMVNCAGAVTDEIPLIGLPFSQPLPHQRIYHIPKTMTNGRSITSAYAIVFGRVGASALNPLANMGTGGLGSCGVSPVTLAARSAAYSFAPIPNTQTADVTIIAENTVLVEGWTPIPGEHYLRVMLGHDEELSSIQPRSWPVFAELVVAAAKAYIYNNYYIELGAGELVAGMQLGQIKDIIDQYQDASETMDDIFKNKWGKVAHLNDPGRKRRHLALTMGGKP